MAGTESILVPATDITTITTSTCGSYQLNAMVCMFGFTVKETSSANNAVLVFLAINTSECDAALSPSSPADNFRSPLNEGRMEFVLVRSKEMKQQFTFVISTFNDDLELCWGYPLNWFTGQPKIVIVVVVHKTHLEKLKRAIKTETKMVQLCLFSETL